MAQDPMALIAQFLGSTSEPDRTTQNLESVPHSEAAIQVLCFSKDRTYQLSEYLRTFQLYTVGPRPISITVIWAASSEQFVAGYEKLMQCFPTVNFMRETNLAQQTRDLIATCTAKHFMFGVDDTVFYRPINLSDCALLLEQETDVFGYHVKLTPSMTECHPAASSMKVPSSTVVWPRDDSLPPETMQSLIYPLEDGTLDWNYPWELIATLYRTTDCLAVLDEIEKLIGSTSSDSNECVQGPNLLPLNVKRDLGYGHPNRLEINGHKALKLDGSVLRQYSQCACIHSKVPVLSVVTINVVQDQVENPVFDTEKTTCNVRETTLDVMNDEWLKRDPKVYDLKFYREASIAYNSVHVGDFVVTNRSNKLSPIVQSHESTSVDLHKTGLQMVNSESEPKSDEQRTILFDPPATANSVVSVVMCVHNGERYLEDALQSCVTQTSLTNPFELELILVDDCSTDNTAMIMERLNFARKSIVKLSGQQPLGIARALNVGIKHATGDFIARLDADDMCAPYRFAIQLDVLLQDPSLAGVGANVRYIGAQDTYEEIQRFSDAQLNAMKHSTLPIDPPEVAFSMLRFCALLHPTVMLRTPFVRNLGGYSECALEHVEDYDLWIRSMMKGYRFANVEDYLVYLRLHISNVSKKNRAQQHASSKVLAMEYLCNILNVRNVPVSHREFEVIRACGGAEYTQAEIDGVLALLHDVQQNILSMGCCTTEVENKQLKRTVNDLCCAIALLK